MTFTTKNSSTAEPITADSSAIIIPIPAKPTPSATKQSFEAFKETWQLQIAADKSLPAGALRVALAISAHMNRKQNGLAWPGYKRLQRILGIGRSTVIRSVKRFEKAGHLSVKRQRNGSKNAPNEYQPKLKGSVTAMTPPPHPPGVTDDITLMSQLRHPPSVIAVKPEPLNEPPNEPLIKKERGARHSGSPTLPDSNPIIQTKLVAEEVKIGTNVTTIAQPSLVRNRSLRGKRLPEDWRPLPDDEAYARNLLGDSGFATTLENFRDYWLSRADAGATKLDWARTWRIWCRKDAEDSSLTHHPQGSYRGI